MNECHAAWEAWKADNNPQNHTDMDAEYVWAEAWHAARSVLMTPSEVAEQLAVPIRTLQYWRDRRMGPAYLTLGPKLIRYRRADIDAFLVGAAKK